MKRIKPQQFLILLLVAALAAAPFLIRGLIDRSDTGKEPTVAVTPTPEVTAEPTPTPAGSPRHRRWRSAARRARCRSATRISP